MWKIQSILNLQTPRDFWHSDMQQVNQRQNKLRCFDEINPCYYRLSQSRMLPWSPKGFKSINRDPYFHLSGCPRRLQSRNFKSLPWDQWGFTQPQNLLKNSYKILYIFPVFWLLLIPDGVEFIYETTAGSVFCEAIHRKRDITHQDARHFFHWKKGEAEAGAL